MGKTLKPLNSYAVYLSHIFPSKSVGNVLFLLYKDCVLTGLRIVINFTTKEL